MHKQSRSVRRGPQRMQAAHTPPPVRGCIKRHDASCHQQRCRAHRASLARNVFVRAGASCDMGAGVCGVRACASRRKAQPPLTLNSYAPGGMRSWPRHTSPSDHFISTASSEFQSPKVDPEPTTCEQAHACAGCSSRMHRSATCWAGRHNCTWLHVARVARRR
jgi:hypothetical protein